MNVELHKRILLDLGCQLKLGSKVLDFGCGAGETVCAYREAGYDAFGCDIVLEHADGNFLYLIDSHTLRIPFDDNTFDLVISESVFEHVMDYRSAISEIRRVLKPGGASLHMFPAKWRPIEAHVFVPFAGAITNYPWLLFWSLMRIRNSFQTGKGFREVAKLNYEYLKDHTCYLHECKIKKLFSEHFEELQFVETSFIKYGFGPSRHIYSLVKMFPFFVFFYRNLHTRSLFLRKAQFAVSAPAISGTPSGVSADRASPVV